MSKAQRLDFLVASPLGVEAINLAQGQPGR